MQDLPHECGIDVIHAVVRIWWNRFGPMFAKRHLVDSVYSTMSKSSASVKLSRLFASAEKVRFGPEAELAAKGGERSFDAGANQSSYKVESRHAHSLEIEPFPAPLQGFIEPGTQSEADGKRILRFNH